MTPLRRTHASDIDALPLISENEEFCFDCHPHIECFNACCAELTLPLTPYDLMRARRNRQLDSESFIEAYTEARTFPENGFPLLLFKMEEKEDSRCPFVSVAGCGIYKDRPGACRAYPLGRGTKIGIHGVNERFFIIRDKHCKGFESARVHTPETWLAQQGMAPYNYFNDRYMTLISLVQASGIPLDERQSGMALLCLYKLEKIRELFSALNVFSIMNLDRERQNLIMSNSLSGESACLDFAMDWLELIFFGKTGIIQNNGEFHG